MIVMERYPMYIDLGKLHHDLSATEPWNNDLLGKSFPFTALFQACEKCNLFRLIVYGWIVLWNMNMITIYTDCGKLYHKPANHNYP